MPFRDVLRVSTCQSLWGGVTSDVTTRDFRNHRCSRHLGRGESLSLVWHICRSLSAHGCDGISPCPSHDGVDDGDMDESDDVEICLVTELQGRGSLLCTPSDFDGSGYTVRLLLGDFLQQVEEWFPRAPVSVHSPWIFCPRRFGSDVSHRRTTHRNQEPKSEIRQATLERFCISVSIIDTGHSRWHRFHHWT